MVIDCINTITYKSTQNTEFEKRLIAYRNIMLWESRQKTKCDTGNYTRITNSGFTLGFKQKIYYSNSYNFVYAQTFEASNSEGIRRTSKKIHGENAI